MEQQFGTKCNNNNNHETFISMHYENAVNRAILFIESLNEEISNDDRIKDYISNLSSSVLDINNIKNLIETECVRFFNLSNDDSCKFSDTTIAQTLNNKIDSICLDFNKLFYRDGFTRRFIRDNNSVIIVKVSEEIKNYVWNVIAPWSQKYCVALTYLDGINIKDIETEFSYYPIEETINYLTTEPIKCVVFPRTSLSKILKVINGIKIKRFIKI